MIIKFSWGTGKMSVDAETMIRDMPMTNFRKWVKLFARWGLPEDQVAFLYLLQDHIYSTDVQIKELEAEVNEFRMKADRVIPTQMSVKYCKQQATLKQKHLNGAKTRMKRLVSMRDQLKGRLS